MSLKVKRSVLIDATSKYRGNGSIPVNSQASELYLFSIIYLLSIYGYDFPFFFGEEELVSHF